MLAHGRFLLGWRLSLARTELSRADRRSLYRVFWKQAQRQHMAGSLLFETVGGSCLDRGHLTGPCRRGGSPRPLSAPSHDTVAVLYHPGPQPRACTQKRKHPLLSALRKLCPLYHSHLRWALQEEAEAWAQPKACRGAHLKCRVFCVKSGCSLPC